MSNTSTYLQAGLWEASEEGAEYECTMDQIVAFISNKIDNGDLPNDVAIEDIEVEDFDGYVHEFKMWLGQNDEPYNASIVRGYENGGNFS